MNVNIKPSTPKNVIPKEKLVNHYNKIPHYNPLVPGNLNKPATPKINKPNNYPVNTKNPSPKVISKPAIIPVKPTNNYKELMKKPTPVVNNPIIRSKNYHYNAQPQIQSNQKNNIVQQNRFLNNLKPNEKQAQPGPKIVHIKR